MSEERESEMPDPEMPSMAELVGILGSIASDMEDLLVRAVGIGLSNANAEDHLVIASLRRGLDNIDGLIAMAERRNLFCGMPIVRFQVDTAMTLFGRGLVNDVEDYVEHMLRGCERRDFKDRSMQKMTDGYLHRTLDKQYETVSSLYSDASGFVHFSTHHLHRVLDLQHRIQTGEWRFLKADAIVAGWPDEEVKDALLQCAYASDVILSESRKWEKIRWPDEPL